MIPLTEDDLQKTLIDTCRATGRRVFHTSDSRKQVRGQEGYEMVGDPLARGYPDLTVVGHGETLWAELKGPRGKLEEEQVRWLDELPSHRGYVWRTDDLDEAIEIVTRGHPEGSCRSCWACCREEILKRVGIRKQRTRRERARRGE